MQSQSLNGSILSLVSNHISIVLKPLRLPFRTGKLVDPAHMLYVICMICIFPPYGLYMLYKYGMSYILCEQD